MFNQGVINEGLFNDFGLAEGGGAVVAPSQSFHASLGNWLYPQTIDRERRVLFGEYSVCELYSLSPAGGEESIAQLNNFWVARRIPTIESGAIEQWRLELANELVDWEMLATVSTVRLYPDTGEVQHYRVMQTENAMKPGHVYHLRIEAIAQL